VRWNPAGGVRIALRKGIDLVSSDVAALPPYRPLADAILPRPSGLAAERVRSALLIAAGSLIVAASAQIAIPIPGTPVPITGQTLGVLLVGMLLGSRRGALSLALYLLEGAANLPVFAGGRFGLAILLGPTGGYLFSYPVAAALMGALAERGWDRRLPSAIGAMLLGGLLILALGTLTLSFFVGGLLPAVEKGCLPFLPGDTIKTALAAALLPAGWRLVGGRASRRTQ
jgi:biotin transport system substrate-specific component